jgi:hypothetical protein
MQHLTFSNRRCRGSLVTHKYKLASVTEDEINLQSNSRTSAAMNALHIVIDPSYIRHIVGKIKAFTHMLVFALICFGNGRAFDANQI